MRRLSPAVTVAVAACVAVGAAAAATPELELAQRYAPVVRLVSQDTSCAHGEPYRPTDVKLVMRNPGVVLRGPWDHTNVVKVAPSANDLSHGLFDYHLDFPGSAVAPGCVYDEWSHRVNEGATARTYARVVSEAAHPDQVALQYWFFYLFNDFNDKHEGDWEMIQLDFPAATAAAALGVRPDLVGYSQHEGGESAHWGDDKLGLVGGTHPVVYSALGSHANYFSSALHLGRSAAQGVGCDETSAPSRDVRPAVSLVPTAKAEYLRAYPWLGFEGHWGEQHEGFYNGPTGPNTKAQWTEPITWANEEWRDASYTVPGGNSIGTTATDFFCGAVAGASTLLTALVGNPSPVLIALAGLVALLLWLTSRTEWRPSEPFHLSRKRRWGAIVAAARRLYFGNFRLFVGIGLIFLPLGVLLTGLQYLIFRVGGLGPLTDAAGPSNAVVAFLAFALGLTVTVLGLSVLQTVTALAMNELDQGRKPTVLSAYKLAAPKLVPVLGAVVLAAFIVALCGFSAIGVMIGAWLAVRWSLIAQVVALESTPARSALRRSAALVRGDWWRTASLTLFVAGIALLLGPLIGTVLLFITSASFDFVNLVSNLVYAIVLPFAAIATTYLYFDLYVGERQEAATAESGDILPAEA